jgi:hypothetical protein
VASSTVLAPVNGSSRIGSSAVTDTCTASVSHHTAIHTPVAAVARAAPGSSVAVPSAA